MDDLISRQQAVDALCSECQGQCIPCESYPCSEVEAINALPSAQPEQSNASEFWQKRADFYSDMCMDLIGEMEKGVKIGSVKISENGIEFIKEQPPTQPEPHYDEWCTDCKEYDHEKHCCPRWNWVIRETLEDAQPEQRWIPCSERLPEIGKDVLVCYDFKGHRSVLIGALYGDEKFHGYDDEYLTPEGRKYRKVLAWKPLPEPYRGGI